MIATVANLMWLASRQGAATRFRRQLLDPRAAQEVVLRNLLRRNAVSAFGRQHGFARIHTPAEFAARVPLCTYEQVEPWINRIMQGEQSVLTIDPVTHLVPTSGSSGAHKLIPFTAQLQREFDQAIGPWVADLYGRNRSALFGPAYWSISPTVDLPTTGFSALPIGFEDDTSYLGGASQRLVTLAMAVPSALREVKEMEKFFVLTLVCLLRRSDLRLISVWHPSFLLLLLEAMSRHWETIVDILQTGRLPSGMAVSAHVKQALRLRPQPDRAREVGAIGPDHPQQLWPKLAVISCWTDAHAALGAAALACRFPNVTLQPKGLLATEAIITLPFENQHPVAVGSHYFEFINETGGIQPVESLQQGQTYEVVVTTGGGLWRYRLGDRVRVESFAEATPSLRFIGRAGDVSDLCGEKLTAEFVAGILQRFYRNQREPVRFAMLAPDYDQTTGGYTLFWEGGPPPVAQELDFLLAENPHYAWCRRLGQLRQARVFEITAGAEVVYFQRMCAVGRKLGDIKPGALNQTTGWALHFAGHYRE